MARIFLCHASEDKVAVRDIYQRLRAIEGFEPWLDEEDLLLGQVWEREIPRALKASEFILIFLSRNSVAKRGYVQREMKLALDALQEVPEGTIHTIPVRLDECPVPEQLQRYHYANLFDARGFERLVRAIRAGLSQRQQPGAAARPEESTGPAAQTRVVTPALAQRLTNSIGMEFMLIAAGTFLMGGDVEATVHQVTISQPFYLGKYAVTREQWAAVMGTNPSGFQGDPNRPVEQVSWNDVQGFIRQLNAKEGGASYRLPTEAEWEYACRAGSTTAYCFGDDPNLLGKYGWYDGNADRTTHPVGQCRPNVWGLYDMHGNIFEWVQDWFGEYALEPVTDPQGPASGLRRVVRGGSWHDSTRGCRSAYRDHVEPGYRGGDLGFRLLREAR